MTRWIASLQSSGVVTRRNSGGTSQPGGIASSPHSIVHESTDLSLGVGLEMVELSWRSSDIIELMLPAREDVERSAGLDAEVSIMRLGGRARMLTERIQPMPRMASEDTMALFSDNIH